MEGKTIFLLYPYYWPHYKAGGPVQSLFNLTDFFKSDARFYVVSLANDVDGVVIDSAMPRHKWLQGPNHENIYFCSTLSLFLLIKLLWQIGPDIVFINGIFNGRTAIPGLFFARMRKTKVVISPRGMLQEWALKRSHWKKRMYLWFFKKLVPPETLWHATDQQEKEDIQKCFGRDLQVHIASNIPRRIGSVSPISFPDGNNRIRLIFLSLINPNKNLHLVIDAVNRLRAHFTLDIYGPVIDNKYWKECQQLMVWPDVVSYKGPVPAWEVSKVLSNYHFFVLPTAGENFGHAIFDALGCGVPVIITRNTPWKDIEQFSAGMFVNLDDPDGLVEVLKAIAGMTNFGYRTVCTNSYSYASQFWASKNYASDYSFLFEDA